MTVFEIILTVLIVGMMALLLFMTKTDKDLVRLTQFTELYDMYDDIAEKSLKFKKYLDACNMNPSDIDNVMFSYIYLTGKSDGIYEALEKSKKIAEEIIY